MPKAKFPVVDIHSHTGPTPETIERLIQEMDALNLRVLNNLSGGSDPAAIKQKVDYIRGSRYPDRFRVFANVDWNGAGAPGWSERAVANLEACVRNGAIGLKIFKSLGLQSKKADGSRLKVDDPVAEADLGPVRAPRHPGAHPHRRTAGVLLAARLPQRALARARAVPGSAPLHGGRAVRSTS